MNHTALLSAISKEVSEQEGCLTATLPSLANPLARPAAVECLETVDSTNTRCLLWGKRQAPAGALICAELQTAGRGRRGRVWQAPAGTNIAMSLLLRPRLPLAALSELTLISALAVRQAVCRLTGLALSVKWPNDLLFAEKKLCGILVELAPDGHGGYYTVVGIGLNVFSCERPAELRETALSLEEALREERPDAAVPSRESLIAAVCAELGRLCAAWEACGDLSFLRTDYEAALAWRDESAVLLAADGSRMPGILRGISRTGRLLFEVSGALQEIEGGELSLRRA